MIDDYATIPLDLARVALNSHISKQTHHKEKHQTRRRCSYGVALGPENLLASGVEAVTFPIGGLAPDAAL